jgi:hypothetical protein
MRKLITRVDLGGGEGAQVVVFGKERRSELGGAVQLSYLSFLSPFALLGDYGKGI